MTVQHDCIVVGIGNSLLKGDHVGIEVVKKLVEQQAPVDTSVLYSVGLDVLDVIMGYKKAIIVDACQMGHPPGTILEMTPDELFTDQQIVNSHAVTLGSTLRTGQMGYADKMPQEVTMMLIEVEDINAFSIECSPSVKIAIIDVVDRIHPLEATYGEAV